MSKSRKCIYCGVKWLLIIILALFVGWLWQVKSAAEPVSKVIIGQKIFYVDVADSPKEMARGLSGRPGLAPDHGLLFIYPDKDYRTFWMKDMNFAIDLLWIDGDKVVGLEENMLPEPGVAFDDLRRYNSPQPVSRVLEIPAGSVDASQVKVGDIIKFSL